MAFSWKLYGDGKTPPLGEAVAPDERLSWPRTAGIGSAGAVEPGVATGSGDAGAGRSITRSDSSLTVRAE